MSIKVKGPSLIFTINRYKALASFQLDMFISHDKFSKVFLAYVQGSGFNTCLIRRQISKSRVEFIEKFLKR